jgi:hypothetical protein
MQLLLLLYANVFSLLIGKEIYLNLFVQKENYRKNKNKNEFFGTPSFHNLTTLATIIKFSIIGYPDYPNKPYHSKTTNTTEMCC